MIETVVETYDGSTAFKKDCRFIKGDFYIKNKQCFLIDGVWYRVNSGFIMFDHEQQTWVVAKNTPTLMKGIVAYDKDTHDVILGHYTPNMYKNVTVFLGSGSSLSCIDYKILPSSVFSEDTKNMVFVHDKVKKGTGIPNINFSNNGYPYPLPYCCKHYPTDLADRFKDGAIKSGSISQRTNVGKYISSIKDFTFGFEFETTKGKVPNYRILESGLMPLRDGSITGIEYATIPLKWAKGVDILENACDLLKKYTTFSEQESLHLHIGNVPSDKKSIAYLYTVCCILEKEIYSLFPQYYAQTSKFKAKAKDYNMPLKKELVALDPKETFDNLAFYLSSGKKYQGFGSEHPSDPEGHAKWGIQERYHWVNFIPLLFGSNKTLEFRCHVPTRDPVKVLNWLYICSAIIKFAEGEARKDTDLTKLKETTLDSILCRVYSNPLSTYLCRYITSRKENRKSDQAAGDGVGSREIGAELQGKELYKDI
jgi:hypothetical protein